MLLKFSPVCFMLFCFSSLLSCKNADQQTNKNSVTPALSIGASLFDTIISDKKIALITLRNDQGSVAQFTNFGGRWVSFFVPAKNGVMTDIIVGPGSIKGFLHCKE